MKIRNKIALWIVAAGVCVSLIFSTIVFWELAEESYELIDTELTDKIADFRYLAEQAGGVPAFLHSIESLPSTKRYLLCLYDIGPTAVWKSALARKIEISRPDTQDPFTVTTKIRAGLLYPDMESHEKLGFRVRSTPIRIKDATYTLLVGIPIENPVADILELVIIIAIGFGASAIILFVISYWMAGRILKPVSDISRLAGIINEKTLAQRIPLAKNRDELHSLCKTLNSMFDRLQFSFEKQKQFLAAASHELKSPVALLRLKVEEYLQSDDLPEGYKASLIGLSETLHRMNRLITNLLDLSALEHTTTRLHQKEIPIDELVMTVLDNFTEAFHARHLTIRNHVAAGLEICGDADTLQRVIVNLIDNAVKYNDDYGTIEIEGHSSDSQVHLSIGNTSTGIPEVDLPHIFEQFYRIEKSRSAEFGGVGLGLTIVKRIVELHGGAITAHSEPGKWTQMELVFPLNRKNC